MKTLLLTLTALCSAAALALPASVRYAEMEVTYASGFYSQLRGGVLEVNYSEANSLPESFTFSVDGRKLTARLTEASFGPCGNRFTARLNVPDQRQITDLELMDYSELNCRLYVKNKWHAQVRTQEPDGSISKMELVGDPR